MLPKSKRGEEVNGEGLQGRAGKVAIVLMEEQQ